MYHANGIIRKLLNLKAFEQQRKKESEVAQLCLTRCDPMDCSLPGSSVHGIFQARVLELIAISFSRGSSRPRDRTWVSHIVDRRFTIWATRVVIFIYSLGHSYLTSIPVFHGNWLLPDLWLSPGWKSSGWFSLLIYLSSFWYCQPFLFSWNTLVFLT